MTKATEIVVKAEKALREELKLEFKSIRDGDRLSTGYASFYVDPEYKKVYFWYRLAVEDSEPVAVQKGHDIRLIMIDEKAFKDKLFADEEGAIHDLTEIYLEKIAYRLKKLGIDIKDCEVII